MSKLNFNDANLTIIIPVYNTESYLLRCLESVDNPNVNVIIVDDGSYDKSPQIIDCFCSTRDNFEAIHISNHGAAYARLVGLKNVKTEYFAFVDSDDIANIDNMLKLCDDMKVNDIKVGNGRMTVYLPGSKIPLNSRKWHKEKIDFDYDKLEFSNITCSLLDKIWHISASDLFMEESSQKLYEDLEFVYYVMAKQRTMLHSDSITYNYCMRSAANNGTSLSGLKPITSNGLEQLIGATTSMKNKFKDSGLYDKFSDELDSIIIKNFYQRMRVIMLSGLIENKKEMLSMVFGILDNYIPDWRDNPYYLEGFKGCEYNDYISYLLVEVYSRLHNIISVYKGEDVMTLLDEYNRTIILKK